MTENYQFNVEKNYISLEDKALLIDFLLKEKGIDFSEYSEASVRRRISKILSEIRIPNVKEYIEYLKDEEDALQEFIEKFTVNVTEMFRDPYFFESLIKYLFPLFHQKDRIKIWSAGCSTGEEVLSLAILLKEHGLLNKAEILGTDLSDFVLEQAESRIYKIRHLESYNKAYRDSGGKHELSKYYTTKGDEAQFEDGLYENIRFEKFNLVEDQITQEFDLVVCRNVLIYFNASLQDKVIQKLNKSLLIDGHMALGSKESVIFYTDRKRFNELIPESKIYQKVR